MDIESLWDYADPAASEARFWTALEVAQGDERLELLTQIARTYSLRQRFDEAHRILDDVEKQLEGMGDRSLIRYLLERGRSFRSAGETERSRPLFIEAFGRAQATGVEGLATDAAHMVAITYSGTPDAFAWNDRGLAIARASQDGKARSLIGAFLNNKAWDLFDMGRLEDALPLFEAAQAEYAARGDARRLREAMWAVGRCLRALRRYSDALAIQRSLEADHELDGAVNEEIAENLAALGRLAEAKPYYQKAFDVLSQDEWVAAYEAERLARLKSQTGNP